MEKQNTDGSKFLRWWIYNSPEEALLWVLHGPTRKNKTEWKPWTTDETAEKFAKTFFPGIQKPLQ